MGCERLAFTLITLICGLLIIEIPSIWIFGFTLIFYCIMVHVVRSVNKKDPQFFYVMYRYVFYLQDYYPSNSFYSNKSNKLNYFIK